MQVRRRHRSAWIAVIAAAAAAGIFSTSAFAGITTISRELTIRIDATAGETVLTESQVNPDAPFGPLNISREQEARDPVEGTPFSFAFAQSGQQSDVPAIDGAGPWNVSAILSITAGAAFAEGVTDIPLSARAENLLRIVFEVTDQDEPFTINGEVNALAPQNPLMTFELLETSTPPAGESPISFTASNVDEDVDESLRFTGALTLRPGTYTVTAQGLATNLGDTFEQNGALTFDFSVGDAVTPPPPPPNGTPIPLPAGVWAGMLGLAAAAGAVRKRARR
jgi:hypothetical protein